MTPKSQLVKCIAFVILYITVCFFLLKVRKSFYPLQELDVTTLTKNSQVNSKYFTTISHVNTVPVDLEIKILEKDVMNGHSVNLQESVALLKKVTDVCTKTKLNTPLIRGHFLYSPKHKALYCWIRKVASSSFTKLFSNMSNHRVMKNYYRQVNSLTPQTTEELQFVANDTNIFKLLIVRHPFQRLVSSYRDRIEDNSKHSAQAWIYTKTIFRLTRPDLFHSNTTTGNFMRKIFTPDRRLKVIPTFREFIQWLLQSNTEDDVHWNQYYKHCGVCNINYNYILKLDDYSFGQINYVFAKLGLDKNTVYLPDLERTHGGNTDFVRTCEYLGNLTHDMILNLYDRYKFDFEMYNYDLNKYMFCAKNNS